MSLHKALSVLFVVVFCLFFFYNFFSLCIVKMHFDNVPVLLNSVATPLRPFIDVMHENYMLTVCMLKIKA